MTDSVFHTWTKQLNAPSLDITGATGSQYILSDGGRVYDFLSTSFQASFGHSHDPITNSIKEQLDNVKVAFPKSRNTFLQNVTQRLLDYLGLGEGKVFYTVSGAESNENAAKMARQMKKAPLIMARHKSYHGASLGALSLTGDWRNQEHITVDEWTLRIPEPHEDPDLSKTRNIILQAGPENIAGIILETISGANGVIIPPQTWWDGIQELCDEFNILMILDEVLCGFGRTGTAFGFQQFNLRPDFVTLSKAISGGYVPMGALWVKQSLAEYYDKTILSCGLTNYAHPLGLAAMKGVLDTLEDKSFLATKAELEKHFQSEVAQIQKTSGVKGTRSCGLLAALELEKNVSVTWADFIKQGIHLLVNLHTNQLILAPPFIMSKDETSECFSGIKEVLKKS